VPYVHPSTRLLAASIGARRKLPEIWQLQNEVNGNECGSAVYELETSSEPVKKTMFDWWLDRGYSAKMTWARVASLRF